ncbi:MAG: hypothetical protein MO847_12315 [Candidatus Protistobacter heckmanni]|nr:hypothetical protein [Candidatus Protistobacter heckmanni]
MYAQGRRPSRKSVLALAAACLCCAGAAQQASSQVPPRNPSTTTPLDAEEQRRRAREDTRRERQTGQGAPSADAALSRLDRRRLPVRWQIRLSTKLLR